MEADAGARKAQGNAADNARNVLRVTVCEGMTESYRSFSEISLEFAGIWWDAQKDAAQEFALRNSMAHIPLRQSSEAGCSAGAANSAARPGTTLRTIT